MDQDESTTPATEPTATEPATPATEAEAETPAAGDGEGSEDDGA